MTKKEIISIAGTLGSGKSSTSDRVAEQLGFERFSSGDFFRKVGVDLGLSVDEVNKRAETDPEIDRLTDYQVMQVGKMKKVVIDSRMAFHFIPESFKVFLDLPPEIAKQRILNNLQINTLRQQSENSATVKEIYEKITARLESEKKRYKELYDVDSTDKNNFDLVIDTDKNNLEQVVALIVREYKKWIVTG